MEFFPGLNVCRGCKSEEVVYMDEDLCQIFEELTGVEISIHPYYLRSICLRCNEELKAFKEFRSRCIAINEELAAIKHVKVEIFEPEVDVDTCSEPISDQCWEPKKEGNVKEEEDQSQDEEFDFKFDPNQEEIRPSRKTRIICELCGILVVFGRINDHILRVHTDIRPFTCEICAKSFKDRGTLDVHIKELHYESLDFQCDICKRFFSSKNRIYSHIKKTHTAAARKMLCPHCPMGFPYASRLRTHMVRHNGNREHACVVCNQRFTTRGAVRVHLYSHSTIDAFTCPLDGCERGYSKLESIKLHLRRDHGFEWTRPLTMNPIDIEQLKEEYANGLRTGARGRKRDGVPKQWVVKGEPQMYQ